MSDVARSKGVAEELVRVMGLDNGVTFLPFPAQMIRLQNAVMSLMEDGVKFTSEEIVELTCGEVGDVEAKYGKFQGFKTFNIILNHIFEGLRK